MCDISNTIILLILQKIFRVKFTFDSINISMPTYEFNLNIINRSPCCSSITIKPDNCTVVQNPALNSRAHKNKYEEAVRLTEPYISGRLRDHRRASLTRSIPTGWIIMYKTVRKGDASLQYTILPQTDQFSSGGFPQTSGKPRPRIIKYTMGTVMVLIILSCVATPFLINQNDHNLFASTMLAMSRVEPARNTSRSQTKDVGVSKNRGRIPTMTVSTTEVTRRKDLEDTTTSFNGILRGEEEEAVVDDATLAGICFIRILEKW